MQGVGHHVRAAGVARGRVASPLPLGARATGIATAVVAAVTLFVYCGTDWATEPTFVRWANTLPDDASRRRDAVAAEHLRIFPNAGEGLVQQMKHNVRGHGCYVLGEWHPRAVWYYFPVVLSAKLPEPLLLLLPGCWCSGRGAAQPGRAGRRGVPAVQPELPGADRRPAGVPAGGDAERGGGGGPAQAICN